MNNFPLLKSSGALRFLEAFYADPVVHKHGLLHVDVDEEPGIPTLRIYMVHPDKDFMGYWEHRALTEFEIRARWSWAPISLCDLADLSDRVLADIQSQNEQLESLRVHVAVVPTPYQDVTFEFTGGDGELDLEPIESEISVSVCWSQYPTDPDEDHLTLHIYGENSNPSAHPLRGYQQRIASR